MRFAVLGYNSSCNIGDEIQSVAAARLLPRVDCTIAREELRDFHSDEKHLLVMNGWFGKGAQFPPADCIIPLYIAFHTAEGAEKHYMTPEAIAHFRKWQPIGCRDRGTMKILQATGVDAFYSKCLTLTLAKRDECVAKEGIFAVDIPSGESISRRGTGRLLGIPHTRINIIRHGHNFGLIGDDIKMETASRLLRLYQNAELVITSRLHCALPCVAMGVPVLYFGVREYRTEILADIGITMHRRIPNRYEGRIRWELQKLRFRNFRWVSETPDIENEKAAIVAEFNKKLFALSGDKL